MATLRTRTWRPLSACAAIALAVAALVGCSRDSSELPVPGRWEGSDGGVVTLESDGRGELLGVPYDNGGGCSSAALGRFDGPVTWTESESGTIEVRGEGGFAITLWADRGGFGGDVSWFKIALGPCGDRTTASEVLTYTRDTQLTAYGPHNATKGDAVKISGDWRRVVRTSTKSVSVEMGYSWTRPRP